MPFVVRATGLAGTISWLSAANENGIRTLVTREMADVFQTVREALAAIDALPSTFGEVGLNFDVRDGRSIASP